MIIRNLESFHGLPVEDFDSPGDIAALGAVAVRLRCDYDDDETLSDLLSHLLDEPQISELKALVFGYWTEDGDAMAATPRAAIELLVANKDKLPNLEALFVGDIISDENEISWINNADMSPIWAAFPRLREFGVRGSNNLRLGKIRHSTLSKLVIECGGLPAALAREALDATAPLEHFELWFGDTNYGLTTSIDDLSALFAGTLFPQLKTLALRNCSFADDIAERLATAPVLDRIKQLDLSLGTLTDRGAMALARSGRLRHLEWLNITHHYVGDSGVAALAAATPKLIADDRRDPEEWDGVDHYYVSVAE